MKTRTSIALAAVMLLSGAAVASAAQSNNAASQSNPPAATQKYAPAAKPLNPSFSLTAEQRKTAWQDMSKGASDQNAAKPYAQIGDIVPSSVKLTPVPSDAVKAVPKLGPYDFAMVQHKLLIVNPRNKVVAYVITGNA